MGILFIKLRLFPQSPLHLKHAFSALGETLYAGRVKPFAEASELITHAVSQLVVIRKTASSVFGVRPSGGQKGGSRRVQNGD
jgi:hypothetical protein